jgi:hypothetical protein
MADLTQILNAIEQGDPHAAAQLLPVVYDELRKLAALKMAQESPGQTLQATALVHEAYLRLVPPAATSVTFRVQLPAGKTRLRTWFTEKGGVSRGAYFVDVKYLD